MKRILYKSIHSLLILSIAIAFLGCTQDEGEITTIILVRNAEVIKERNNPNPALAQEGVERAQGLAILLKDNPLEAIYALNNEASTQTVEPTAISHNLDVISFEKNDLTVIDKILQFNNGKKVLMVTNVEHIPQILNQLVGEAKYGALPEYKFDNFYVISILKKGKVSITTLKYGDG